MKSCGHCRAEFCKLWNNSLGIFLNEQLVKCSDQKPSPHWPRAIIHASHWLASICSPRRTAALGNLTLEAHGGGVRPSAHVSPRYREGWTLGAKARPPPGCLPARQNFCTLPDWTKQRSFHISFLNSTSKIKCGGLSFCCHLHILDFKHSLQIVNFLSRIVKKSLADLTISTSWFFYYWSRDFLPSCLVLTSAEWMLKWENIREIFSL